MGLRVRVVERNRSTGQFFDRALNRRQAMRAKFSGRLGSGDAEALVAPGEGWIEINRGLKKSLRQRVILGVQLAEMPQAALISSPGVGAFGWLAHRPPLFGIGDGRGDSYRHRLADLILHREDVGEVAVVAVGPDMVAGLRLDQLRGDADAVAGFAQA